MREASWLFFFFFFWWHLILFCHFPFSPSHTLSSVLLCLSLSEPSVCHISKKGSIWHDVASALGVSLPSPPVVLVFVRSLKLSLHVHSSAFHQREVKRSALYNCFAWHFTAFWSREINRPVSPTFLSPLQTPVSSQSRSLTFYSKSDPP